MTEETFIIPWLKSQVSLSIITIIIIIIIVIIIIIIIIIIIKNSNSYIFDMKYNFSDWELSGWKRDLKSAPS